MAKKADIESIISKFESYKGIKYSKEDYIHHYKVVSKLINNIGIDETNRRLDEVIQKKINIFNLNYLWKMVANSNDGSNNQSKLKSKFISIAGLEIPILSIFEIDRQLNIETATDDNRDNLRFTKLISYGLTQDDYDKIMNSVKEMI